MRITESQLHRINREEAAQVVREGYDGLEVPDEIVGMIENYARLLLLGDMDSLALHDVSLLSALMRMRDDYPDVAELDVRDVFEAVANRVFSAAAKLATTPEQKKKIPDLADELKYFDENFLVKAFPENVPAPKPTPPRRLKKVLKRAGEAARKLKAGKGPKNFDKN